MVGVVASVLVMSAPVPSVLLFVIMCALLACVVAAVVAAVVG